MGGVGVRFTTDLRSTILTITSYFAIKMFKSPEKKSVPKSNQPPEAGQEQFFGGKGIFDAVNGGGNGGSKAEKNDDDKSAPAYQYQWSSPSSSPSPQQLQTNETYYTTAPLLLDIQDSGTKDMKTLGKDIDKIGVGMEAEANAGLFANLSIKVEIPTEVPGLFITVELAGKYTRYPNNEKKLSVQESVGVEYEFLEIFSLAANLFLYLNLEGKDLGAAFIDALKQTTFYMLEGAGINKEFAKLAKWKDKSSGEKALDLVLDYRYGPFSSFVQLAKIYSSTASAKEIEAAYQAYLKFFKNNETVGFELGLGGEASAGADVGGLEATVSAQAIVGLEDVDKKKVTEFAEVAFAGEGKHNDSKLSFRLSKRWRGNGTSQIKFEFDGEFAGNLGLKTEVIEGLREFLQAGAFTTAFTTVSDSDKEGKGGSVNMTALKEAVAMSLPVKTGKKKMGLSLSFTYETGHGKSSWKVEALIKVMKEFKDEPQKGTIGPEIEVQYGTFIEISGEIQQILNEIHPPKTNKTQRLTPLPQKTPPIKK